MTDATSRFSAAGGATLRAAAMIAVVLVAFIPAMRAGTIWDDDVMVFRGAVLSADDALARIWTGRGVPDYYPLTWTSLWLDRQIFGDDPSGYHVVNIILHALASVVLWRVLRRLNVAGAYAAAMIFAVHPVTVSSVAWIVERKNTLSMLLLALSVWAYLRSDENDAARRRAWYGLSLATFLLAMLSKVAVAMMPVAMLLLIWWRHGRVDRRAAARLAPFFAISLVLGVTAIYMMREQAIGSLLVRPEGPAPRVAAMGWCVWFYLYKIVLPIRLAMVYPRWDVDPWSLWAWAPLAMLLCVFVASWRGRRGWGRHVLVALGGFVVLLFPALGLFDISFFQYALVADHFQYLAMIAPIALIVAGVTAWLRRLRAAAFIGPIIAASVVFALAIMTWHKSAVYENQQTLWNDTLAINPRAWIAHNNLGFIAAQARQPDRAMQHYEAALAIQPHAPRVHNNLGIIFAQRGQLDAAAEQFRAALDAWPDYDRAHSNLGLALMKLGDPAGAVEHYRRALVISPGFISARANLGDALLAQQRYEDAAEQYRLASQQSPADDALRFKLGMSLHQSGDTPGGIAQLREAVRLNDKSVRNTNELAWVLATWRDATAEQKQEALTLAERAAARTGRRNPRVLDTLAAALAANGRYQDAAAAAERAFNIATDAGGTALADEIKQRLKLYSEGRRYIDTAP